MLGCEAKKPKQLENYRWMDWIYKEIGYHFLHVVFYNNNFFKPKYGMAKQTEETRWNFDIQSLTSIHDHAKA